jgi:hypothetical protein
MHKKDIILKELPLLQNQKIEKEKKNTELETKLWFRVYGEINL